jgi:photosystem II stability/assembly factor-like uncharacterized protein
MIAGRPLSYPQTHLHTVLFGDQPQMVYLGTHYGLFISTNGGRTWPQKQGELHTNMITALAVSPTNPNWLAALAVPTSGLGSQMGVYISADGGQQWHLSNPPGLPSSAYPYAIVSNVGAHGRFYAFFTYAGWFETQDLGQHWYTLTSGNLSNILTPSLLTDPGNPAHLIMGGDQGLFQTWDDGQQWQQLSDVQGSVVSLAGDNPALTQGRTILCATSQGLYLWQDGQQPQIRQLHSLPSNTPPTRLVESANGSALYALFGSDLWFSPDLGASWTHRWHFARTDLVALALNPSNTQALLAGFFSPGLVLSSSNGGASWQTLTS